MCGVPYHAAENYIARLIQKGYRVAICDQMEDPRFAKKLVKREVTRIVTPGTAMTRPAALARKQFPGRRLSAMARAPASPTSMSPPANSAPPNSISRSSPRHSKPWTRAKLLVPAGTPLQLPCLQHRCRAWVFGADYAARSLREHFHLLALDGCGLEGQSARHRAPRRAILHYLRDTQRAALDHLERPRFTTAPMRWCSTPPPSAISNWSSLCSPANPGIPRCFTCSIAPRTGMGGRLLRHRLLAPVARRRRNRSAPRCRRRTPRARPSCAPNCAKDLASILDLERLLAKITLSHRPVRAILLALARSLAVVPIAKAAPRVDARNPRACATSSSASMKSPKFATACSPRSPTSRPSIIADGGAIRDGFDAAPRRAARHQPEQPRPTSPRSSSASAPAPASHRSKSASTTSSATTSKSPKRIMHLAPADYERKQTLVNAERFTTPELKELRTQDPGSRRKNPRPSSAKSSSSSAPLAAAERRAHQGHRRRHRGARRHRSRWPKWPPRIAIRRPRFLRSAKCASPPARHPVIEKLAEKDAQRFIPNDLYFHPETEFIAVITGPNMGGKSTYLRQAALLAILAQMGSFVPADAALLPDCRPGLHPNRRVRIISRAAAPRSWWK